MNFSSLKFLLQGAIVSFIAFGCAKEDPSGKVTVRVAEGEKSPAGKSADGKAGSGGMARPVKWDAVNKAVIGPKCAVCHTPGGASSAGIDLTTYDSFKAVSQTAYLLMLFTEDPAIRMPKGAPLNAEDKQWIANYLIDGIQQ
jgi:hypothetical protein